MKKIIKLIGFIALAAILAFGIFSCGETEEKGDLIISVNPSTALIRAYMDPDVVYVDDMLIAEYTGTDINFSDLTFQWKRDDESISSNSSMIAAHAPGKYTVTATAEGVEPITSNKITVDAKPNYADFLGEWFMDGTKQSGNILPGAGENINYNKTLKVYYNRFVQDDSDRPANPDWTFNISSWKKLTDTAINLTDKTAGFNTGYNITGSTDTQNSPNYSNMNYPYIGFYLHSGKNYLRRTGNTNLEVDSTVSSMPETFEKVTN